MPRKPLTLAIPVPVEIAKALKTGDAFDATFEGAHYAQAASVATLQVTVDDDGRAHEHAEVTFEMTGKLRTLLTQRFPSGGICGVSIGPL